MAFPNSHLIISPESAPEIVRIADRALRTAGARGKLPTPIEDLIQAAKITDEVDAEGIVKRFISSLKEGQRAFFRSSMQKLRGIADLRERAVYVPTDTAPRERFAKGHELGHQLLPWHRVNTDGISPFYQDNEYTLSPRVQDMFDIEANLFSSEVIFQGREFTTRARDYRPSFDAVFVLANLHGASRQATLRRYVEVQDEMLAAVSYLPSRYDRDKNGQAILRAPSVFGSPRFVQKYGDVQLPTEIKSDHPWGEARRLKETCEGDIDLDCGGVPVRFWWQAWWNTYTLLVLLRRRPSLGLIGRILRA
jgi:Zn-dependent peptidase ImmA (M78 family)